MRLANVHFFACYDVARRRVICYGPCHTTRHWWPTDSRHHQLISKQHHTPIVVGRQCRHAWHTCRLCRQRVSADIKRQNDDRHCRPTMSCRAARLWHVLNVFSCISWKGRPVEGLRLLSTMCMRIAYGKLYRLCLVLLDCTEYSMVNDSIRLQMTLLRLYVIAPQWRTGPPGNREISRWAPASRISSGPRPYMRIYFIYNQLTQSADRLDSHSRWKDPRTSRSGGGLTYAQGPHVTYVKNFLGERRCMTVVVL